MRNARNVVLTMAAAAMVLVLAGCSDNTHGSQSTLKLIEPGGNVGTFKPFGNVSRNKISPGGGFAFSTPLQDSSKKNVGELNAVCIATKTSTGNTLLGTCTGTSTVPGGSLALNVGGKIGNNVSGAIVGGTGKYAGATGTFSSSGKNAQTDTYNITLP
jgi:hypothetical protein